MSNKNIRDIKTAKIYVPTVLLLDDQDVALTIHVALIRKLDPKIKTVVFKQPKDALDWLKTKQADLIITDYIMEGMNGIEFIESAKLTKHAASTPFVVVTASHDTQVHLNLHAIGVYKAYTKPVDIKSLSMTCRTLLNMPNEKQSMPS